MSCSSQVAGMHLSGAIASYLYYDLEVYIGFPSEQLLPGKIAKQEMLHEDC